MIQSQISVDSGFVDVLFAVVFGIAVYFLKQFADSVKELAVQIGNHETRISLLEQMLGHEPPTRRHNRE